MITVLLVDNQALLRLGFRMILKAEPDLTVVGEAADGHAAVSMTRALQPDVVLMDVRMPGPGRDRGDRGDRRGRGTGQDPYPDHVRP